MSCFDVREVMELRPEIEKLGGEIKNDWYDLGGPFSLGEQTLVLFPNGYGASVIRKEGSYGFDLGLMELGVIKWSGKDSKFRWNLDYDNPVIEEDSVLGFLDKDGLLEKLEQISKIKEGGTMDENKGYEGFERFGLKLLSLINEYDLKFENDYEIKEDTDVLKYTITLTLTGYFPK